MRLFAVSDVHGNATALKAALDEAGYNPSDENHLLISCGDNFDRGNENVEVLKFLERIDRKILIEGNHEHRLRDILNGAPIVEHDYHNGTVNTLRDFFGEYSVEGEGVPVDFSGKSRTVDRLLEFIGETRYYFETEKYVFLHGWLPNNGSRIIKNWRSAPDEYWYRGMWTWWIKGIPMEGNNEEKTIVCGHYPSPDGKIYEGNCFFAIDSATYSTNRVNVFTVEDELL